MSPLTTASSALSTLRPAFPAAGLERIKARLEKAADGDEAGLARAAREFEAMFLAQMLAPMFESLESDGLFGGGPAEDIYRSLLADEYGKAISRSGGVGIADQVQAELLRLQETQR